MGRFRDALCAPGLRAIAEVKRRSPSAGELRADADPGALAAQFEAAGAAAVSILVDRRFAGSLDDLRAARSAAALPLLAKGFFTSEQELDAARAAGADAVLLLLRNLDDRRAAALMAHAGRSGLDALVEAHDAEELLRAVNLGAPVIGVNARNLDTFSVDLRIWMELLAQAPKDRILVAESGIEHRSQAASAEMAGADAILVGSSLMRAPDPAERLTDLMRRPLVKVCGLTREEDVSVAAEAGADLAGFILAKETPRRAPAILPVPETMLSVGVFVGEIRPVEADLIQFYERENGHRSRDGVLFRRGGNAVAQVVDRAWQEEDPEHLERARAAEGRVLLAGGLGPENVGAAIEAVRPWAVDASSSLEVSPGIKDHERVRAFVAAAREAAC